MKSEIDTGPYVLILNPTGMWRRSDVSIRSQIDQDVADHDETSARRRNSYSYVYWKQEKLRSNRKKWDIGSAKYISIKFR